MTLRSISPLILLPLLSACATGPHAPPARSMPLEHESQAQASSQPLPEAGARPESGMGINCTYGSNLPPVIFHYFPEGPYSLACGEQIGELSPCPAGTMPGRATLWPSRARVPIEWETIDLRVGTVTDEVNGREMIQMPTGDTLFVPKGAKEFTVGELKIPDAIVGATYQLRISCVPRGMYLNFSF